MSMSARSEEPPGKVGVMGWVRGLGTRAAARSLPLSWYLNLWKYVAALPLVAATFVLVGVVVNGERVGQARRAGQRGQGVWPTSSDASSTSISCCRTSLRTLAYLKSGDLQGFRTLAESNLSEMPSVSVAVFAPDGKVVAVVPSGLAAQQDRTARQGGRAARRQRAVRRPPRPAFRRRFRLVRNSGQRRRRRGLRAVRAVFARSFRVASQNAGRRERIPDGHHRSQRRLRRPSAGRRGQAGRARERPIPRRGPLAAAHHDGACDGRRRERRVGLRNDALRLDRWRRAGGAVVSAKSTGRRSSPR